MDLSLYNKSTNMMSENILYTVLNARAIITGTLTGLFASLLGSALAGTAIYKRRFHNYLRSWKHEEYIIILSMMLLCVMLFCAETYRGEDNR